MQVVIVALFAVSIGLFSYYIYLLLTGCKRCTPETKEELPCPSTCSEGYECKPSETVADIVIGDIVQEEVVSEDMEEAPAVEEAPVQEAPVEEAPVEEGLELEATS